MHGRLENCLNAYGIRSDFSYLGLFKMKLTTVGKGCFELQGYDYDIQNYKEMKDSDQHGSRSSLIRN